MLLEGGYISTSAGDELLDMGDFILLFIICFCLICFEFFFCTNVGIVISSVVDKFTIDGEIHDLRTDIVEEILRMGSENETMWVFRQVCFKPHYCFKIKMIRRFIEQE